jgi:hypothetical protein
MTTRNRCTTVLQALEPVQDNPAPDRGEEAAAVRLLQPLQRFTVTETATPGRGPLS